MKTNCCAFFKFTEGTNYFADIGVAGGQRDATIGAQNRIMADSTTSCGCAVVARVRKLMISFT
jgi:hypothetical protein